MLDLNFVGCMLRKYRYTNYMDTYVISELFQAKLRVKINILMLGV